MITKFDEYKKLKLNEDGDGGGCGSGDAAAGGGSAYATLGGGGMGAVIAPQPGSTPGTTGTIGSGDRVGGNFGPYFKQSPYGSKPVKGDKRRRKRRKKSSGIILESHCYYCNTCGERLEHEEYDEDPNRTCSNCGDSDWIHENEYDER